MAGSFLGGYTGTDLKGYSNGPKSINTAPTTLRQTMSNANAKDNMFLPNTKMRPSLQLGARQREYATQQKAIAQAKSDAVSPGARLEAIDESMEGEQVYGKLGKNYPGDTRMAEVLKALGVAPDFMNAIIASAQIRESDNR